jgi:hypothetical protein
MRNIQTIGVVGGEYVVVSLELLVAIETVVTGGTHFGKTP